jgi:hypothetical protein
MSASWQSYDGARSHFRPVSGGTQKLGVNADDAYDSVKEAFVIQLRELREQHREQWRKIMDDTLIEMGRNPERFADRDEGDVPPTPRAIETAINFVRQAQAGAWPPAGQVLSDGEGGILIQRALPDGKTLSFEAADDGSWMTLIYRRPPLEAQVLDQGHPSDGRL